jgi:HK97 family phage major capsid protein
MNKRLKAHEDRKAVLLKSAEAILDAAGDREMSDDETLRLDAFKREMEFVDSEIKLERHKSGHDRPACEGVAGQGGIDMSRPYGGGFGFDATDVDGITRQGRVGARYADLFGRNLSNDGWPSKQAFLQQIHSGMAHPNLSAMVEGTGSGGGWMVPTQYAAEMLDAAMEDSIVMKRAKVYPMTTETMKIAGFDASTNTATSLYGGMTSQWLGETDTGTVTNPVVRKIELHARKLALFTSTSNEIAEDGIRLDGQLSEAMGAGNSWFLDYAFLRGTGVGQPLGVLNDPAIINVTIETAQDADTIVYENLINMLARLHPGCFKNSVWLASTTCIPQLLSLAVPIGLSGQYVPVLKEADGGWNLLTRPMIFTEKLPTLGDKGDIILADLSQYAIGLRKEISLEKSQHILFMSDQTVWRAITRVDGQGRWNQAFTPANGSSQSWCVTLAERA